MILTMKRFVYAIALVATCTYDVLDGGWYHVSVPDKGKSNTIIITVDPLSGDGNPREAIIGMQAGDAFTKISIAQK